MRKLRAVEREIREEMEMRVGMLEREAKRAREGRDDGDAMDAGGEQEDGGDTGVGVRVHNGDDGEDGEDGADGAGEDEDENDEEENEEDNAGEGVTLRVGCNCALGHHRSVAFVSELAARPWPKDWIVEVVHRDLEKKRAAGAREKQKAGWRANKRGAGDGTREAV